MNGSPSFAPTRAQAGVAALVGVLLMVLGLMAIASPLVTGVSVAYLVGTLMLIAGLGQCIFAFGARSFGSGLLKFLLGGLSVACGVVMIGHPLLGLGFLTLLLATYFVVEGIFEAVLAFQVRPVRGWGWTLLSGVVSVALGLLIWNQFPLSGVWAVGILVGIKLALLGVSMLVLSIAARNMVEEAEAILPVEVEPEKEPERTPVGAR